jgi:hypothetical protein
VQTSTSQLVPSVLRVQGWVSWRSVPSHVPDWQVKSVQVRVCVPLSSQVSEN